MPLAVWATPALSRSRPSTTGARPAATSRCDPSRRSPLSRITATPAGERVDARDLGVAAQIDAFALQARDDDGGKLGIVLGEEVGDLQHGDPRAQPAMGLRHLQADRPAADHDQMAGQGAVGEDRLVGEIARFGQAGDRRRRRSRAGRQNDASALMRCGPACNSVRPMKRASSFRTRTPSFSKRSTESLGAMAAITSAHVIHDAAEIDRGLDRRDAEGRAVALRLRHPGGGDQRLGRHAAMVEAIAAHLGALDQHDARGRAGRRRTPRPGPPSPRRRCRHPERGRRSFTTAPCRRRCA